MRRPLIILSAALAVAGGARAAVNAEAIPPDFLQQFAPFAIQLIQQQFPNAPVKVDPSAEKTVGYHVQEMVGVVLMPDKNLTAKVVEEAGEKEVPIAVLATKSLAVGDKDGAVNKEKVAIADFNGMFKIPVFFLSVKGAAADRTLVVYSKEGTPLATAPLKKQAGDAAAPVQMKLTDIDLEKKTLNATVSLNGAYEGTLKLGFLEP
jgi:hypothetical protein